VSGSRSYSTERSSWIVTKAILYYPLWGQWSYLSTFRRTVFPICVRDRAFPRYVRSANYLTARTRPDLRLSRLEARPRAAYFISRSNIDVAICCFVTRALRSVQRDIFVEISIYDGFGRLRNEQKRRHRSTRSFTYVPRT